MRFAATRPRRQRRENVVPMINVVFLLLVFLLMTARLAPPEPFAVDLPEAAGAAGAPGPEALLVAADGRLAFGVLEGAAAIAAAVGADAPLILRADRGLPAAELARLLARLAALGQGEVRLLTRPGAAP